MSQDIRSDPTVKTWLESYPQKSHDPMVSNLRGFMGFLDEMEQFKDITPSVLINHHKQMKKKGEESEYEVWKLLQKYVQRKSGTAKTKRLRVSHVRSFFSENFAELPSKPMRVHADKDPVKSLLDHLIIKDLIDNSKFDMKAFYLTLFMGFMGVGEFLQFNKKYAKALTNHLKTKGVDEPFLIDFPGRKSTKGKSWFYTFIGRDALVAWKNYFERQRGGYPKDGEAILLNQYGKPIEEFALRQRHMRLLAKLNIIKRGKSKDVRHGYGMHNTRDAAKTYTHLKCKDIIVEKKPEIKKFDEMCVEFWLGHTVDRYGYDQFYKDKEYVLKHYKTAEKYLNIVSGETADTKVRQELETLKAQDKIIHEFIDDSLQEKTKEMQELNSQVKNLTSQVYLIKLEKDESEPFTIPDGLNIDYDRWLSKNENWIQLKNMDPELAKKHYERSDLRTHVEMCKEGENGEHKAFMERWRRKAEVKKKVTEFQVKKAAKRVRYEVVDRPAKKKK